MPPARSNRAGSNSTRSDRARKRGIMQQYLHAKQPLGRGISAAAEGLLLYVVSFSARQMRFPAALVPEPLITLS